MVNCGVPVRLERHVSWSTFLSHVAVASAPAFIGGVRTGVGNRNTDAAQEQIHCRPHLFPRLLDHTQTVRRTRTPQADTPSPLPSLGFSAEYHPPTGPNFLASMSLRQFLSTSSPSRNPCSYPPSDGHAISRCLPRFSREIALFLNASFRSMHAVATPHDAMSSQRSMASSNTMTRETLS